MDDSMRISRSYDDFTAATGVPYYYWIRATNDTSGSQSDFQAAGAAGRRTQVPPVLTTLAISNNILGSAKCGGDVLDEGGSAVTNRGIVWNTFGNPTVADSKALNGSGAGAL
jgi:hypothetical protein